MENVFEVLDLARSFVFFVHEFLAALSHLTGEFLIAQEVFDASGKAPNVHPRNKKSIDAVNKPLTYAAGIESNNGQAVTHCFGAGETERLGPNRTDNEYAALEVIVTKLLAADEPLKLNAIGKAKAGAKTLTSGPMAALAKNYALEFPGHFSQRLEQNVHAFATDNLAGIKN
jgi:hypothetical protein